MKSPRHSHLQHNRLASYWRARVMVSMRDAGHTYRTIAEYFHVTPERVRQIVWHGARAAQLELPCNSSSRTA